MYICILNVFFYIYGQLSAMKDLILCDPGAGGRLLKQNCNYAIT